MKDMLRLWSNKVIVIIVMMEWVNWYTCVSLMQWFRSSWKCIFTSLTCSSSCPRMGRSLQPNNAYTQSTYIYFVTLWIRLFCLWLSNLTSWWTWHNTCTTTVYRVQITRILTSIFNIYPSVKTKYIKSMNFISHYSYICW